LRSFAESGGAENRIWEVDANGTLCVLAGASLKTSMLS
jgi:hypothetical protein